MRNYTIKTTTKYFIELENDFNAVSTSSAYDLVPSKFKNKTSYAINT